MAYIDNFKVYGPYKRKKSGKGKGRQIVVVVDRNGQRRTVSYPKWLMELQLGRPLDPDKETVDHWDSDINNNSIENLRIIPRDIHSANDTRRVKPAELKCAWCNNKFERNPRRVRDKARQKKAGPFCGRQCAGRYARMLQLKIIKKFKPQKPVKSQYFKRKYIMASVEDVEEFDELDIDINFIDLLNAIDEEDNEFESITTE